MNYILLSLALSVPISVFSTYLMIVVLRQEVLARDTARKRYEADPELYTDESRIFNDFYVPTITIGHSITFVILWVIPIINLVSLSVWLVQQAYERVKRVWNNPLVPW